MLPPTTSASLHRRQWSRRLTRSFESICYLSINGAKLMTCSVASLDVHTLREARVTGPIRDAIFQPVSRRRLRSMMLWGQLPNSGWLKRSNRRPQRNRRIARSWSVMDRYVVGNNVQFRRSRPPRERTAELPNCRHCRVELDALEKP